MFFKNLFSKNNNKEVKLVEPIADEIINLESKYSEMNDEDLKQQTEVLKNRLNNGETLDDILVDAFAVIREASYRVLGMKHFKVQLIGGIILHQGRIAEMRTGEGKTLVSTLPVYLNSLTGNGVHVVTVNDYLAKRDSEWMGKIYSFLGVSVGFIKSMDSSHKKRQAYSCDITYGTNNEFGFDYLRDNMVLYDYEKVQRGHNFAVIDEVDSILIDEARTPLIISGQGDKSTDLYEKVNTFAKKLTFVKVKEINNKEDTDEGIDVDYIVDEKAKTATLTKYGIKKAEEYFNVENLIDSEHLSLQHHINQAIRAHSIMIKDIDYVVNDGQVIIVDEFTGRLMEGRRYSDGLHQAIESKEGVKVERESKTLATITFQNYFRLYKKISGMTGTALTEENEFREIYHLDVVPIPTNKPIKRIDRNDLVYKTKKAKYNAVVEHVIECNKIGQPVLVGTVSIEDSEYLSSLLLKRGVKHKVLNAKYHDKEAEIVAQAGKLNAVTIATNMAGRGTDIVLGGNPDYMAKHELRKQGFSEELIIQCDSHSRTDDPDIINIREEYNKYLQKYKKETDVSAEKIREIGGLCIIGTERHESRRIDNQLRGRAGRQGDEGTTTFYISLEDDLMRLFGGDKIYALMDRLNIDDDMIIENRFITSQIENAQKKIEGRNFNIRKSVLGFDDVMNVQRNTIYQQRDKVLNGTDLKQNVISMIEESINTVCDSYISDSIPIDEWNLEGLKDYYLDMLTTEDYSFYETDVYDEINAEIIKSDLINKAMEIYSIKETELTNDIIREAERVMLLTIVDRKWIEHIDNMEELKRGIYLRSYAQHDPITEYRLEGFDMFDDMVLSIKEDMTKSILTVRADTDVDRKQATTILSQGLENFDGSIKQESVINKEKIGRNDKCPCNSGKKYKLCCGKNIL